MVDYKKEMFVSLTETGSDGSNTTLTADHRYSDDSQRWVVPLYDFIRLLSAQYGYDIAESIRKRYGWDISEDVYNPEYMFRHLDDKPVTFPIADEN